MPTFKRVLPNTAWNDLKQEWMPDADRLWHRLSAEAEDFDAYCGMRFYLDGGELVELSANARGLRCQECVRLAPEDE